MMSFTDLAPVSSADRLSPLPDQLRLAVAGYPARFKGASRQHTESDLRCFLCWCAGRAWTHWLRKNLDRHPNYILAAYMASGT